MSNADQNLRKDECIAILKKLVDNFKIDIKDEVRFFFTVDIFFFLFVGTWFYHQSGSTSGYTKSGMWQREKDGGGGGAREFFSKF